MDAAIAQILAAASDALRSQFKREFIARIDIALHNQRLAEVNKAVTDFFRQISWILITRSFLNFDVG